MVECSFMKKVGVGSNPITIPPTPQDIEILGWCPTGTVLPHGAHVPL